MCLESYKQSKYSFINFFTAKYVKIVAMSKIFKYIKKSKLCILCENMYLSKSQSPTHNEIYAISLHP